jgi:nitroimidazol reductase NimA-like FMN-containing flavoprotein (pyridoxamine 5'-phosphate oxidase superfamily)
VLSTVSPESDMPQSALVYYVVDESFPLFIVTIKQSRKIKNLLKNQKVSLVIFSEIPPIELQIEGTAEIIEDPHKKNQMSERYLEVSNKNPETLNWPPILKLPNSDGFEFLKVTIDWFKYSDFSEREGSIVEGTPADWQ